MLKNQEGYTLPACAFLRKDADDGAREKFCHDLEKLGSITG